MTATGGRRAGLQWAQLRTAPLVLQVTLGLFAAALLVTVGCMLSNATTIGGYATVALGATAILLGSVLASDVAGSAGAMAAMARPGRSPWPRVPSGAWTARRFRLFGGFYVLLGCGFVAFGVTSVR